MVMQVPIPFVVSKRVIHAFGSINQVKGRCQSTCHTPGATATAKI